MKIGSCWKGMQHLVKIIRSYLLADSIKALAKLVTIKEIPLEGNDFETPICEEPAYLYEGWMMFEKSNGARNWKEWATAKVAKQKET